MISEKMMQLGKKSSIIREIFEYGKKRKMEIGAENVFDFSIGNPSVPAPKELSEERTLLSSSSKPSFRKLKNLTARRSTLLTNFSIRRATLMLISVQLKNCL